MPILSRSHLIALLASISALVAGGVAAAAATKPQKITPQGVGAVKLGATYSSLYQRGLIGTIHHGCPLAGPNTRAANLRPPLKGSVDFTTTNPRKVADISVSKGGAARGVGIGDRLSDIKAAFPKAKVDHSTEHTFGVTLVRIPKNGGGKLAFAVDVRTKKITLIGVPFIATCD